ncbi:MAG: type II secretion system protein [Nitrospirae bacterium]|nr:type II secretion system protein [Nitrospirota bacterium]
MGYTDIEKQKGFTLIEIAIVLVIIGILLSIGAGMVGTLTKRAKYNETKEIINAAVESVISYGAANNKLPIWGDGVADGSIDEFVEVIRNPNDAWTKPLYYIYDNNLTDVTIGGICGRKTTNLTVRICPDAACSTPTNIYDVAFIVLSGSENYNNQTAGNQGVTSATTINVYEVDVPNIDNYAGDINRPEPYDDIVKWITIDELRIKAGCVGAQLRILNNELPFGTKSTVYATAANPVRIIADGGVPFPDSADPGTEVEYKWCIQRNPASAPPGLSFRNAPDTANIIFNTDCSALAEGSWVQSDNIIIYGTPNETPLSSSSNYTLTFFVRDNNDSSGINDNITQKTFVLTINPTPPPVIVRNATGTTRYYRIDGGSCVTMINNATVSVGFTQMITFFKTPGNCSSNIVSCSHNNATLMAFDTDTDGQVRLSSITDTSCTIADD